MGRGGGWRWYLQMRSVEEAVGKLALQARVGGNGLVTMYLPVGELTGFPRGLEGTRWAGWRGACGCCVGSMRRGVGCVIRPFHW